MSTPGSGPTDGPTASAPSPPITPPAKPKRVRIVRWEGFIPLVLLLVGIVLFWLVFGDRVVRVSASEAATKALGTQVDVASLEVRESESSIEIRGVAIADPFNLDRNVISAERLRLELEPTPLLEKKLIVRRLVLGGVRFGSQRARRARRVDDDGFAAVTLRGLREWAANYRHPVLALTPIDTIRQIVLDPTQLGTVRAATALASTADSVRNALESGWRALELRATYDTSEAIVRRLAETNPRTLGIDGTRRAIADVRRVIREVDEAKNRVETLHRNVRAGVDVLEAGVGSFNDARRADYAFARGLLKIPSLEGPDIGGALFGPVTLDRYQQVVYWAELAQKYMPPGLRPRTREGPERLRASGEMVAFPKAREYPSFHLQTGELDFALDRGSAAGTYAARITDLTTAPALVRRPTQFTARRDATGRTIGALDVTARLDHTGGRVRDSVRATGSQIRLPSFAIPELPLRVELGTGRSQLDFIRNGDLIAARWSIRAGAVRWTPDSARQRTLNTLESIVTRVLSGVNDVELTANFSGQIRSPSISISSNLDRVVAARIREVAGEEIAKAETRVRAAVDSIVEERTAPVRARVAELRADAETRVTEARARLEEERQKLQARLNELTRGMGGVLPLPR